MLSSQKIAPKPLAVVLLAHFALLAAGMSLRQERQQPPLPVQMIDVVSAEPRPQDPQLTQPVTQPARVVRVAERVQQQERAATAMPVATTPDVAAAEVPSADIKNPAPVFVAAALPEQEQSSQTVAVDPPTPTAMPARFDADYLDNPRPPYPPLSRRSGEQGKVVLRVHVEANGLPSMVEVHTTSGFERLDKVAAATVKRWRFTPGRQGSTPVATRVDVPITFTLEDARS